MAKSFKEACCEKLVVSPHQYEEALFWKCLPLHARLPALMFGKQARVVFQRDFAFLSHLATISSRRVLRQEINRFHILNSRDPSIMRGLLKMRLSGKQLLRYQKLLGK
jgi:hypothetical protein